MNDPRLAAWLASTRAALAAPREGKLTALTRVDGERAALQRALERDPPSAPPTRELALALQAAERELQREATSLAAESQQRVGELRRGRRANFPRVTAPGGGPKIATKPSAT